MDLSFQKGTNRVETSSRRCRVVVLLCCCGKGGIFGLFLCMEVLQMEVGGW